MAMSSPGAKKPVQVTRIRWVMESVSRSMERLERALSWARAVRPASTARGGAIRRNMSIRSLVVGASMGDRCGANLDSSGELRPSGMQK